MAGNDSSRKPLKTLVAVKDKKYPTMWRLQFVEGGKVPANLSGLYKNHINAKRAVQYYIDGINRPKIYPKAPKNDKPTRLEMKNGEDKDIS
jgi:hypothetical protein